MPTDVPTEKVINLRSQGFDDQQVIQSLQKDGYGVDNISKAMHQSDIKEGISKTNLERGGPMQGPEMQPGAIPPVSQAQPIPQQAPQPQPVMGEGMDEKIEEIAESIIDERWEELTENIKLIVDWKNKVENRVSQIESNIGVLQDNFEKLHSAVIGKISEYDQNIRSVGTNIKALEQVFQKILPGFVDNVHELSRISEKIKKVTIVEKPSKK